MSTRTQIVVTVGPSSGDIEMLCTLLKAGMDVGRLNFSHGDYDSHELRIGNIREAAKRCGKNVPIIQDLSGPRMVTEDGHTFDPSKDDVVTQKDLADLDFGLKLKVDYVAQSYVGDAKDIEDLRAAIAKRGASTPVIAKIERHEAVEHFDDILEEADAIMVARGDLGLSIPIEEVPFVEREIIRKCNAAGKPVIVATQMLYTMVEHNAPTRAEVTDVAFAVMCGADAIMLSEETAVGNFPVQAVAVMEKIASRAEKDNGTTEHHYF